MFKGLALGWRSTYIAGLCGLNDSTVSTYRERVLEKLHGLKNNAELVAFAIATSIMKVEGIKWP